MPRPRKRRRVCFSPEYREFGPLGQGPWSWERTIHMPLEELETIRLIDLEGLKSGPPVWARLDLPYNAMYKEARRKVAESLVLGKRLIVHGDGREPEEAGNSTGEGCPEESAGDKTGSAEWIPGWGRRQRGRGYGPSGKYE
ncbi:MAG: DUF134 domain-containing protein [Brockia lithotrophica]|nr:DUF134 domain-containing protein [Brockia lithotrophica]